jgi:ketosteroid isomerase-like protein
VGAGDVWRSAAESPVGSQAQNAEPSFPGKVFNMKSLFAVVVILLTLASITHGQTSGKNQQELLSANQAYDAALVRGDAAALDRIYADEFIYTTPEGEVRNKAQQLAFTRSGELRLESGRSDDVRIRIYGNTAVMTGRFTAKGRFRNRVIDIQERYTAVWVKRRGAWRLVAEQGNFIKQQ